MPHCAPDKTVTVNDLNFTLEKDGHKSLRLKVRPDGTVLVRAPRRARDQDILAWVIERRAWIVGRQEYFQSLRAELPPPGYAPGDIQRFLGRAYPLCVTPHARGAVNFNESGFHIQTRGPVSESKVRTLLERWFQNQAITLFAQRLAFWLPVASAHGLRAPNDPPPELRVRSMCSRFGSCSIKGVITLNRRLISAPLECIDYVLVHELCHLRHFAHNRPFYNLLEILLPDWQARKGTLKKHWLAGEGNLKGQLPL